MKSILSSFISNDNTKNILSSTNLGSIMYFKLLFSVWLNIFFPLNSISSCCNSFSIFYLKCYACWWGPNYGKGKSALVSSFCVAESVITQLLDHIQIRFTSQLISGLSKDLHKLLKHSNGTASSVSFVLASAAAFTLMFALHLKDSDFFKCFWIVFIY